MRRKLVIDGNAVYEIDDECVLSKEKQLEHDGRNGIETGPKLKDAGDEAKNQRQNKRHGNVGKSVKYEIFIYTNKRVNKNTYYP